MASLTKEINGKEYKFTFGFHFAKSVDDSVTMDQNGIKFSQGLSVKISQVLLESSAIALIELLKAANETETPKISIKDLSEWVENDLSIEELDFLFAEVIEALEKSNFTAKKVKALRAASEQNKK